MERNGGGSGSRSASRSLCVSEGPRRSGGARRSSKPPRSTVCRRVCCVCEESSRENAMRELSYFFLSPRRRPAAACRRVAIGRAATIHTIGGLRSRATIIIAGSAPRPHVSAMTSRAARASLRRRSRLPCRRARRCGRRRSHRRRLVGGLVGRPRRKRTSATRKRIGRAFEEELARASSSSPTRPRRRSTSWAAAAAPPSRAPPGAKPPPIRMRRRSRRGGTGEDLRSSVRKPTSAHRRHAPRRAILACSPPSFTSCTAGTIRVRSRRRSRAVGVRRSRAGLRRENRHERTRPAGCRRHRAARDRTSPSRALMDVAGDGARAPSPSSPSRSDARPPPPPAVS